MNKYKALLDKCLENLLHGNTKTDKELIKEIIYTLYGNNRD